MANYDGSSGGLQTMGWDPFMREARRAQNFLYSRLTWLGRPNALIQDFPVNGENLVPIRSQFDEHLDLRAARKIKENELILLWLGMGPYDIAKTTEVFWNAKALFLTP